MTSTSENSDSTVATFNVGGEKYQVSRDILQAHPNTMLMRIASSEWQKDANATIFLNRDGNRFRYILDFIRDGEVHLPVTVSKAALLRDFEYFGFTDVDEDNIYEIMDIPRKALGNFYYRLRVHISEQFKEKLDEADKEIAHHRSCIKETELKRSCLIVAHACYVKFTPTSKGEKREIRLEPSSNVVNSSGEKLGDHLVRVFKCASSESSESARFNEELAAYGLQGEASSSHPEYHSFTISKSSKNLQTFEDDGAAK